MTDRIDQDREVGWTAREEKNAVFERFLKPKVIHEIKENKNIFEKSKHEEILSFSPDLKKKNKTISIIKNPPEENQLIHLNKLDPLIFERQEVNERVNDFINEQVARWIQGYRGPLRNLPPVQPVPLEADKNRKSFSSTTGLHASVLRYSFAPRSLTVKGEKVVFEDEQFTDINFTPGRRNFDPSKMTDSLAKGIQGIIELIDSIDQGKVDMAPIFVGATNINMALIAQRLGFVIVDECRTPDGNINRNLQRFTVIGRLSDIRSRVAEFKRSGTHEKLAKRNERLQLKPATAA